ncbi:MAG: glycosyltransferase [Chloroflexota bacterium]
MFNFNNYRFRFYFPALIFAVLAVFAGCKDDDPVNSNNDFSKELALRQGMRKLWTDHVVWTREYIIARVDGASDPQAAATRLLKNQDDIGAAIATYYGKTVGDSLTSLLKEHITIAVDLVDAAIAKDQTKFNNFNTKWSQNGQKIADYLSSANPNWPQATLREMMTKHLQTTAVEVNARLNKDYAADVQAFDDIYNHILMMADALSDGIIKQFPDKFK